MDLKNIELINPVHIELSQSGNGEFPDSYKLTERGTQLFLEFGKQCFEAGFIMGARSEVHGGFDEPDFDIYLKSLEDERKIK